MGRRAIDLTNQRFGRLVVIGRADPACDAQRCARWHCRCDCGRETDVSSCNLRSGHTLSCGCLHSEIVAQVHTTHGQCRSRLYEIWKSMIQRCNNPNQQAYADYGGRGIDVCDEWHRFENFMRWAQRTGYRDDLTIDRIDVNGGYNPFNCRWSTMREQQRNRRNNVNITFHGVTRCLSNWAQTLGVNVQTLRERIFHLGWDVERALTTPVRKYHRNNQAEGRVAS